MFEDKERKEKKRMPMKGKEKNESRIITWQGIMFIATQVAIPTHQQQMIFQRAATHNIIQHKLMDKIFKLQKVDDEKN